MSNALGALGSIAGMIGGNMLLPGIGGQAGGALGGMLGDWFGGDEEKTAPAQQQQFRQADPLVQQYAAQMAGQAPYNPATVTGHLDTSNQYLDAAGNLVGGLGAYHQNLGQANQNALDLSHQYAQDPSAAINASHLNWEQNTLNPLMRQFGQDMTGTGGGLSSQGLSALGRGVGLSSAAQNANETQMQLNAQQQAWQNAQQELARQQGLAGTTSQLDLNTLAGTSGFGQQTLGNTNAANQFNTGLQQTNVRNQIDAQGTQNQRLGALSGALGGTTTTYGTPYTGPQASPWMAGVQGGLGMMNFGNQGLPNWLQGSPTASQVANTEQGQGGVGFKWPTS